MRPAFLLNPPSQRSPAPTRAPAPAPSPRAPCRVILPDSAATAPLDSTCLASYSYVTALLDWC